MSDPSPAREIVEAPEWTLCRDTGRKARDGACTWHEGDACLAQFIPKSLLVEEREARATAERERDEVRHLEQIVRSFLDTRAEENQCRDCASEPDGMCVGHQDAETDHFNALTGEISRLDRVRARAALTTAQGEAPIAEPTAGPQP